MSTPKKITIVGTGAIACVVTGFLVKRNKALQKQIDELKEQIKASGDNSQLNDKILELDSQKTIITVLGRSEDSESYKAFRRGLNVNFVSKYDKEKKTESIQVNPEDINVITHDVKDVQDQDCIFVTVKGYDLNKDLVEKLNTVKKTEPNEGEQTKVILAQNGLPCWFPVEITLEKISHMDEDMFNLIGGNNSILGCVIDYAANIKIDEENGKINCNVSTPTTSPDGNKISMPIGVPEGILSKNDKEISKIFSETGFDVSSRKARIIEDVLIKIQFNIAISALTTLRGYAIGPELFNDPIYKALIAEVDNFSKTKYGIPLRDEERLLARAQRSIGHKPSMQVDFELGKNIELSMYENLLITAKSSMLLKSTVHMVALEGIVNFLGQAVKDRNEKRDELKQNNLVFNEEEKLSEDKIIKEAVSYSRKESATALKSLEEDLQLFVGKRNSISLSNNRKSNDDSEDNPGHSDKKLLEKKNPATSPKVNKENKRHKSRYFSFSNHIHF